MNLAARRALVAHFVAHPADALVVLRAGWRLRRRFWWRRAPFLPIPDRSYWAFRTKTAFGDELVSPAPRDMVAAARWSVRQRVGK
ncbi:MAG TPA: hypothetical protein PLG60_00875 [Acidimicrobiales bacterium]|nr:MAG: hypothetical protein B7X07_00840 [Actinobacteria bacterium 21-64-8]HQT99036.1 hypothetical protein [Acidimicrobiales bacterium]